MNNDPQYRQATAAEIPAMQAFMREALTVQGIAQSQIERQLQRNFSDEALTRFIDNDLTTILLAFEDGDLVGLCSYGSPLLDDCDCEDLIEIYRLVTHPHDRDLAEDMVYEMEDTLNENAAIQRLSVYVPEDDRALIGFYAALGFHHELVEDQAGYWYMEYDL